MPKTPQTVTVTYNGGLDQVDVAFPSGDRRRITKGDSVDILASDAAHLSPEEWGGDGVGAAFVTETTQPEADPQ